MHLQETSDKNVSQFWRQTWKEDAGCGKKDIYLHDFHGIAFLALGPNGI